MGVGQIFQDMGIIHRGVMVCDFDMAPALQWGKHHEQIGGSVAFVLIVEASRTACFHRDRHARFGKQLL